MVYDTWDYWVFRLCPSSGTLQNTEELRVSETVTASILKQGMGDTVGSVRKC
jgi:hypothetical protein